MNTYVNGYIVSTVGEYWPDYRIRKIIAESKKIEVIGEGDSWNADYMKKIGFEDIGYNRKYETMVFRAKKSEESCCPYIALNFSDLEFYGYNDAGAAFAGHNNMIKKYSEIDKKIAKTLRDKLSN